MIDLRKETEGVAIFKNFKIWSHIYNNDNKGIYEIRIENGWYKEYNYLGQSIGYAGTTIHKDGSKLVHPTSPDHDMIDFIPCDYNKGLELQK